LHFSLLVRLLGDLTGQLDVRRWGGLLTAIAILLFLGMTVYSILRSVKDAAK
jgi:hypothetical protein